MTPSIRLLRTHFESLEYTTYLENTTTRTRVEDPSQIQLIELNPRGVVLQVPKSSAAQGHHLTIYLMPRRMTKSFLELDIRDREKLLIFTSKVVSSSSASKKADLLTLEFNQFDEEAWQRILQAFAERQDAVTQVVKSMKE